MEQLWRAVVGGNGDNGGAGGDFSAREKEVRCSNRQQNRAWIDVPNTGHAHVVGGVGGDTRPPRFIGVSGFFVGTEGTDGTEPPRIPPLSRA